MIPTLLGRIQHIYALKPLVDGCACGWFGKRMVFRKLTHEQSVLIKRLPIPGGKHIIGGFPNGFQHQINITHDQMVLFDAHPPPHRIVCVRKIRYDLYAQDRSHQWIGTTPPDHTANSNSRRGRVCSTSCMEVVVWRQTLASL